MASGIRATVAFDEPSVCPLAALSAAAETTVDTVTRSVSPADTDGAVTEFRVDAGVGPLPDDRFTHVIGLGSVDVYRLEHEAGADCPCIQLGRVGCPIDRYTAADGRLELTFHATDFDELQTAIGELRDRFPSIDVTRMLRSPGAGGVTDGVFVDRGRLTDRQREVLQAALDAGYFERPRRATTRELAEELGISSATFSEHLAIALRKVTEDVFEEHQ